ncbi:dolichol-phosphate mannosyltransferase [Aspergillus avenaceus]|uniref:Dolichol-phosphate mannosyltransferase n=1 Tax=Aspergillus avenaceus TaxID=36643 RepID=A0A5N6TFZ1_ASPAV|nr:dolichol-phosphate mannosyltransferase [Aspergillus avenaceus]
MSFLISFYFLFNLFFGDLFTFASPSSSSVENNRSMASSYPGVLHQYAPRLTAFEFTTSRTPKPNSLLFVGGLTDGLLTVPYVPELASALEGTDWSVFNVILTSSYMGWGTGSLDQDIEEIGKCVSFVRGIKPGKVVLMGHSTGSQDVLHYLSAAQEGRPALDGAIMQAPVSDREFLLERVREDNEVRGAYEQVLSLARSHPPMTILPMNLTETLGWPGDTPITAQRFLSLASPDSPERPAPDDLFSSDATEQRLRETFGVVGQRGLVKGQLAAMYSGKDEYALESVDKEALLRRWKEATNAGGADKWSELSGVIPGASHNVKAEGQDWLIEHVSRFVSSA